MSKPFRQVPIHGTCAGSNQRDKRLANRRLRVSVKVQLHHDADVLSVLREKFNVRTSTKGTKHYLTPHRLAEMPEVMRK